MNGPDKTKRMGPRPEPGREGAPRQPTPRNPSVPPPRRPSMAPSNEQETRAPRKLDPQEAPTVGRQMTPRLPGAPVHPSSHPAPGNSRPGGHSRPPPAAGSQPAPWPSPRSVPPGAQLSPRSVPPGSLAPGALVSSASYPPANAPARDPNQVTIRPPPNVKPGAMIGDKYRVERELGRGGFGVVVRAVHLTLDQRVAIKVLTEGEGSTDAEFEEDAARFRREAKATAALKSEHVVRVLDVDVLDSGYPYIVMEYLEGRTLHDLAYDRTSTDVEILADYIVEVLAALAEAHSVGIVHRDLKPANVFLSKGLGGVVSAKVLDFGVSKMVGERSQRLTRTGAVVGTVAYMAPEQMLDAKRVDGRADLWSVGLVLFETLTRTHPFGGGSGPKAITAILNDPVPSLSTYRTDLPSGFETVVNRLLEKTPAARFQTAIEAAQSMAPFGTARARAVVEELRRMPGPSGAAAPIAPASSRTAPPPSVAPGGGSQRSSQAKAKPKKKGSSVGTLLVAFLAACLVGALLAMAALVYLPQRSAPKHVAPPTAPS